MSLSKSKTSLPEAIKALDQGRFSLSGSFNQQDQSGFCAAYDNEKEQKVILFFISTSQTDFQEDILRAFKKSIKQPYKNIIRFYATFSNENSVFGVNSNVSWQSLINTSSRTNFELHEFCLIFGRVSRILLGLHEKNISHGMIRLDSIFIDDQQLPWLMPVVGVPFWENNKTVYYPNNHIVTDATIEQDLYALGVCMLMAWLNKNADFDKTSFENQTIEQNILQQIEPIWLAELLGRMLFSLPEGKLWSAAQIAQSLESRQAAPILSSSDLQASILAKQIDKLMYKQKWNKAIALAEFGLEKFESPQLELALGQACLGAGQVHKSLDYLKKASIKLPYSTALPLAQAYMYVGMYGFALTLLAGIAAQDSQNIHILNLIIQCYFKTGRAGAGLDLMEIFHEQLLDYYPNNHFVLAFADSQNPNITPLEQPNRLFAYNLLAANWLKKNKLDLLAHQYLILEDAHTTSAQPIGIIQTKHNETWQSWTDKIIILASPDFLTEFHTFATIEQSGLHAILINQKATAMLIMANNADNWSLDGQKPDLVCRLSGLHTFSNPITGQVFIINIGQRSDKNSVQKP